jgi:hypothetical protein
MQVLASAQAKERHLLNWGSHFPEDRHLRRRNWNVRRWQSAWFRRCH